MKSSASLFPIDQISVIVLKKCPYLRTYIQRLISTLWTRGDFPTVQKRDKTGLAYKKDSNKDPLHFRPVTLQPVLSKNFTSILGNRIYDFWCKNEYIEGNLKRDLWDDTSRYIEYTGTHSYHQSCTKEAKKFNYNVTRSKKRVWQGQP